MEMKDKRYTIHELYEIFGGKENFNKFNRDQVDIIVDALKSGVRLSFVKKYLMKPEIDIIEMTNLKFKLIGYEEYIARVEVYYNNLKNNDLTLDELVEGLLFEISVHDKNNKNDINKQFVRSKRELRKCVYALSHAAYLYDKEAAVNNKHTGPVIKVMKKK